MGKASRLRKAEKQRRKFNKGTIIEHMNRLETAGKIAFINKDDPAVKKALNRIGVEMASSSATREVLKNAGKEETGLVEAQAVERLETERRPAGETTGQNTGA